MRGQTVYKNLVFEGGGVRGMAYAGAIKALEEKGVLTPIERAAGTSAGSIAALMISLGYSAVEIDSIMNGLNAAEFNDGGGLFIGGIHRLKTQYGWYKGDNFEKWVGSLVKAKTGNDSLTFRQLNRLHVTNKIFKDFYCTGTNITSQRVEIFSHQYFPNMPLKTAVRISCAIPFYYEPVYLDSEGNVVHKKIPGKLYQIYVDGGMVANYPITIFDQCCNSHNPLNCDSVVYNAETLGIKLERPQQIDSLKTTNDISPYDVNSFSDYFSALFNLMMERLNKDSERQHEKERTIYISNANIESRVRKMKTEEKNLLFNNGEMAVMSFFQKKTSASSR